MHRLFCIPRVYEYLADGKAPPRDVANAWVSSAQQERSQYGGGLWAISTNEYTANIKGLVRLSDHHNGNMELTYLLHPSIWHKGVATRTAHTIIGACFDKGIVHTIWAGADQPNLASIAVMKRLGMTFRNKAHYPLGPGVEYSITAQSYEPALHEKVHISS